MTLGEAKKLALVGDLAQLYWENPAGSSLKMVFLDCISCAQGWELETMVEKCLGLARRQAAMYQMWQCPTETDSELRERAERYADILDTYSPPPPVSVSIVDAPPSKQCYHSWKSYQGILEKYDYCEFCDLKRKQ